MPPWKPGGVWNDATWVLKEPGGMVAIGGGGAPGVIVVCVLGVVVVCVTPALVIRNCAPYRKLACVAPLAPTATVKMPPRMPMLADGVVTFTSDFLLITPPTKRSVPFDTVSAISPVFFSGS